jgi:DegV family protein with EDD domain
MQIVTDSGTDVPFTPEEAASHHVHIVPLRVELGGRSYREGIDIQQDRFYELLETTPDLPTTSQPSQGDFEETYRRLAKTDPSILSIHMSSGLSGTVNAARTAAAGVPEADVAIFDTRTLSVGAGWQVEAAARAAKAGWPRERILSLLESLREATETMFTLKDLKYLIHGGRISHMKGLIASVLSIKPLIGVEKLRGTYVQMGQERSFPKAVDGLVDMVGKFHAGGSALRVQVAHAMNPEGAKLLQERLAERYRISLQPLRRMSLVLGAHTGPSMIGMCFASEKAFDAVPQGG